jgi:hypothetical protein
MAHAMANMVSQTAGACLAVAKKSTCQAGGCKTARRKNFPKVPWENSFAAAGRRRRGEELCDGFSGLGLVTQWLFRKPALRL